MHSSHVGVSGHTRLHKHKGVVNQTSIRHHAINSSSKRTCRTPARRGQLCILAASSTDVPRQNEVTRSAQDLAQGVQDFLEESQKAFSTDEAPLPEHPVGEEGTIDVADEIDASVSTAATAAAANSTARERKPPEFTSLLMGFRSLESQATLRLGKA